jgi:hypothetical protein
MSPTELNTEELIPVLKPASEKRYGGLISQAKKTDMQNDVNGWRLANCVYDAVNILHDEIGLNMVGSIAAERPSAYSRVATDIGRSVSYVTKLYKTWRRYGSLEARVPDTSFVEHYILAQHTTYSYTPPTPKARKTTTAKFTGDIQTQVAPMPQPQEVQDVLQDHKVDRHRSILISEMRWLSNRGDLDKEYVLEIVAEVQSLLVEIANKYKAAA